MSLLVENGQLVARGDGEDLVSSKPILSNQWHHIALTASATETTIYVDGESASTSILSSIPIDGAIYLGGANDNTGLLAAQLDEVVISNVTRSPDYIALAAAIQDLAMIKLSLMVATKLSARKVPLRKVVTHRISASSFRMFSVVRKP